MRYLMTSTLHGSWKWWQASDDPKSVFIDTLLKKPFPKSEKMQLGIKFEEDVVRYCSGIKINSTDVEWNKCVTDVSAFVRGGLFQERVMMDISFNGMDFLLYGKADSIRRNRIYDIKYSEAYEVGNYRDSVQHSTYMACAQINNFSYLVTDGKEVFVEDYNLTQSMFDFMRSEYSDLVSAIMDDADFRAAYLEKWPSYGSKK